MHNKFEDPAFYEIVHASGLEELTKDYFKHRSANDAYNTWLSQGTLLIYQGRAFDRPASFLHVYEETQSKAASFVQLLFDNDIIK